MFSFDGRNLNELPTLVYRREYSSWTVTSLVSQSLSLTKQKQNLTRLQTVDSPVYLQLYRVHLGDSHVSDLRSSSLAGNFRHYWSNRCTHLQYLDSQGFDLRASITIGQ